MWVELDSVCLTVTAAPHDLEPFTGIEICIRSATSRLFLNYWKYIVLLFFGSDWPDRSMVLDAERTENAQSIFNDFVLDRCNKEDTWWSKVIPETKLGA